MGESAFDLVIRGGSVVDGTGMRPFRADVAIRDGRIARIGRVDETAAQLTQMGMFTGTPAYASPEQAQGREVDPRSDVFSLGVMLHEMATGRAPFSGKTEEETLKAIVSAEPRPPGENATALPGDADLVNLDKAAPKWSGKSDAWSHPSIRRQSP